MSKVVFVDIDGVLNNHSDHSGYFDFNPDTYGLSPRNLSEFDKLLSTVGVEVVISSDWRKHPIDYVYNHYRRETGETQGYRSPLPSLLKLFPEAIVCPHHFNADKILDISLYLEAHKEIEKFAVIDDDSRLCAFGQNFFKINSEVGLQEEDVRRIAEFFK